jgi:hypothetical protein
MGLLRSYNSSIGFSFLLRSNFFLATASPPSGASGVTTGVSSTADMVKRREIREAATNKHTSCVCQSRDTSRTLPRLDVWKATHNAGRAGKTARAALRETPTCAQGLGLVTTTTDGLARYAVQGETSRVIWSVRCATGLRTRRAVGALRMQKGVGRKRSLCNVCLPRTNDACTCGRPRTAPKNGRRLPGASQKDGTRQNTVVSARFGIL